jgi:hypothetical protein
MTGERRLPEDPPQLIQRCVRERRVYWSYHVNMRMQERYITRGQVFDAVATYEVVESYPHDKYLPSYLVYAMAGGMVFHVLFAVDSEGDNVRVITAYHPDPNQWSSDFKTRRKP